MTISTQLNKCLKIKLQLAYCRIHQNIFIDIKNGNILEAALIFYSFVYVNQLKNVKA